MNPPASRADPNPCNTGTGTGVSSPPAPAPPGKEADRSLFRSEAHLREVQQIASLGSWEWDVTTNVNLWSDQQYRILGLDPATTHPCHDQFRQALHPDDRSKVKAAVTAALNHHAPYNLECRIVRPNGDIRYVHIRGQVEYDPEGHPLRVVGTLQDVTETRRITLDLQASQQRLTLAQEGAHVGVWEWNLITGDTYWSPECERLYGLQPGTLKSYSDWRSHIHPDDLDLIDAQWAEISQGKPFEVEYRVLLDEGQTRWILSKGRALYDATGHPTQLSGINMDVTARRHAEAELVRAKEAAEAANVAKSRFLATMSHEIRTPMNGILGMTQLLLMPNLTDGERREYARTILSSGQILLTLLNDVLDLSKIEAGKLQLDSIVFEADSLIRETRALFSGAAHTKSLQLLYRWHGPKGNRYVADAYRLRQMLANLADNAIKFTQQGSIRLEGTELWRDDSSATLEFSVTDTGMGIPPDKQGLLFRPFSQADHSTTRVPGGTGLGLSIVSQLAQMMGGEVGVDSVAGQGSRFWFRIQARCQASDADSRRHERPGPDGAVTDDALPKGRVLAVEDNVVSCMVIESLLNKIGIPLTLAYDGQQALDVLMQGDRPDLILMDLHMPVMDGYEATRRIREWERAQNRPRIPIIALTADAFMDDCMRCMAAGMDDFLAKPVGFNDLRLALSQWMPGLRGLVADSVSADTVVRQLDVPRFLEMVRDIQPLLAHNMFDALARFKELQALTTGTVLADEMNEIDLILSAFRFDVTLQRLTCLADRLAP